MNIKYSTTTLKKIEDIFQEGKYKIRYEKGKFNSGHCILEDKKIVVINKFLDLEGKILALIEILPSLHIDEKMLTDGNQKLFRSLINMATNNKSIQTEMNL